MTQTRNETKQSGNELSASWIILKGLTIINIQSLGDGRILVSTHELRVDNAHVVKVVSWEALSQLKVFFKGMLQGVWKKLERERTSETGKGEDKNEGGTDENQHCTCD